MNPTGSSQFRLIFDPWVPKEFNGKGLRLLVVAESHYDEGRTYGIRDTRKFTQEIVKARGACRQERSLFFEKITSAFVGDIKVNQDAKYAEFWNSIAFCNYVQKFVSENQAAHQCIQKTYADPTEHFGSYSIESDQTL